MNKVYDFLSNTLHWSSSLGPIFALLISFLVFHCTHPFIKNQFTIKEHTIAL